MIAEVPIVPLVGGKEFVAQFLDREGVEHMGDRGGATMAREKMESGVGRAAALTGAEDIGVAAGGCFHSLERAFVIEAGFAVDEGKTPSIAAGLGGGNEQAVRCARGEQTCGKVADAYAVAKQGHGITGDDLDYGEGESLAFLIALDGDDAELVDGIGEAVLRNRDAEGRSAFLVLVETLSKQRGPAVSGKGERDESQHVQDSAGTIRWTLGK